MAGAGGGGEPETANAPAAVRRVGVLGVYLAGRMRKEEAMRPKRFGAEYRAYMGRTGRLTPWV